MMGFLSLRVKKKSNYDEKMCEKWVKASQLLNYAKFEV
jgi:hypothetical protein